MTKKGAANKEAIEKVKTTGLAHHVMKRENNYIVVQSGCVFPPGYKLAETISGAPGSVGTVAISTRKESDDRG